MMGTQRCQDSNSGTRGIRRARIDAQGDREWPWAMRVGPSAQAHSQTNAVATSRSSPRSEAQSGSNLSASVPGGVGRAEKRPEARAPLCGSCSSAPTQLGAIWASSGRGLRPAIPPRSAEREDSWVENKAEPRLRALSLSHSGGGVRAEDAQRVRSPLGAVVPRRRAGAVRSVAASAFVLQSGGK